MLPPDRKKRIYTKPCPLCKNPLPIFSKVNRKLCALCSHCPTCGESTIRISSSGKVSCSACGNDWETMGEFESSVRKAHSRRCKICGVKVGRFVADFQVHLCEEHLICPLCKTPSMTIRKVKSFGAPLYKCAHCKLVRSARALEDAVKLL